jgi:quercetin dioxygenase-like cupin family protein
MLATSTSHIVKAGLFAAASVLLGTCVMFWSTNRSDALEEVSALLQTGETILGQPFSYPTGMPAKVTAAIVTMPPGGATGWHEHPVPVFGYVLEGEITVDYGPHGKRVYRKGDSLMEAINTAHDGHNTGQGIARILAVFMGAEGVENTTKVAPPN